MQCLLRSVKLKFRTFYLSTSVQRMGGQVFEFGKFLFFFVSASTEIEWKGIFFAKFGLRRRQYVCTGKGDGEKVTCTNVHL